MEDLRSKLRIDIEQCFVGHNFPNTEIVDRIEALVNQEVVKARIDEQIRSKVSSIARGEIMFHLPNGVITQMERLLDLQAELKADTESNKEGGQK